MRKFLTGLILCTVLFGSGVIQASGQQSSPVEGIVMKGYEISERLVTINFSIPHGGMVEIRIYDETEKLIWRDQKVKASGDNKVVFKTAAFKQGQKYVIQLDYKTDSVREEIMM